MIMKSFQRLLKPGWVRKLSVLVLKNALIWCAQYIASDSQSPAPGPHMVEVFGTNKKRGEGENLAPLNNQYFG